MIKTFQYRLKDSVAKKHLDAHALSVNFVWNFCNNTQKHALQWRKKWPSGFDLNKLTTGSSRELNLHSQTIQGVCEEYAQRRSDKNRPFLRYRGKKHLGWIPFKASGIKINEAGFTYQKKQYKAWISRLLPEGAVIKTGSFSCDSLGHWFINITVGLPESSVLPAPKEIGADLGLKTLAAFSNGEKAEARQFYRDLEPALGISQRAHKRCRIKAIHQKIAHRRKDYLHKLSTELVRTYGFIAVGNVNASTLAKTKMAKSVYDAGWSSLRDMLRYKAIAHGAIVLEVNEAFSTVTCSCCHNRTGPKGVAGLRIREWVCSTCGSIHDRDTNAAQNILRLGRESLVAGIPVLTRVSEQPSG